MRVNARAADLDKERSRAGQPDRVHGGEVAGQDLLGVIRWSFYTT